MGNKTVLSEDGSTYLGVGFIHLTGAGGYEKIQKLWNDDDLNKNLTDAEIQEHPNNVAYRRTITIVGELVNGARQAAAEYEYLKDAS